MRFRVILSNLEGKLTVTSLSLFCLGEFLLLREDPIVAKRRNLKKEKAERNQAYARQFRQKQSRSFSRGRSYSNDQEEKNEDNNDND